MANYKVTDAELISIADAIRTKGGTSASLAFPSGFVSAVQDLSTGFSAADEGKVVYSGALSVQGAMSISQNSVYDTTLFSQVNVSIPEATLVSKTISENGTFNPADDNADAFSQVVVNVSGSGGDGNYGMDAVFRCGNASVYHSSVTYLPSQLFNKNTFVTAVNFPECTGVAQQAFFSCPNLSIASLPKCGEFVFSIFQKCGSLLFASFPECSSVGNSVFNGCTIMSYAYLPKCKVIGTGAFNLCSNLLSIYILDSSVATLRNVNAFSNTPIAGNTGSTSGVYGSVYVPASLVDAYKVASNWSVYADRITAYVEE